MSQLTETSQVGAVEKNVQTFQVPVNDGIVLALQVGHTPANISGDPDRQALGPRPLFAQRQVSGMKAVKQRASGTVFHGNAQRGWINERPYERNYISMRKRMQDLGFEVEEQHVLFGE